MYLDTLGKKRIQVWINSPGGNIMQAMNIFSAILKSTTPVDTYNVGVCASSAGLVFMAGRKRYMSDYAQFMTHPPYGGDDKSYEAFKSSCVTMLSSKTDISPEVMSNMMEVTTWIGASECFAKGICTDIEVTKESNKKHMPAKDIKAMLAFSNNILNQNLKTDTMVFTKITNKLNLVAGSNEDAILSAINKLEDEKIEAENNLSEAEQKIIESESKVTELQTALDEANTELETSRKAKQDAEELAAETAASEMVNSFKNRIGDKPEVLAKWINMAKVDLAETKSLLEEIPLNVVGKRIGTTNQNPTTITNVAAIMANVAKKNNQ
jgi:membrane-bound ClpP family serine protease